MTGRGVGVGVRRKEARHLLLHPEIWWPGFGSCGAALEQGGVGAEEPPLG